MFEFPKVLVIDDDEAILSLAEESLSELGYEAVTAQSGKEGGEALENHAFDAILLDLVLPDMHGHAVLRQLRRMKREIPVIILSGEGTTSDVVRAWHEGASDYVQKPFDIDDLDDALSRAMAGSPKAETESVSASASNRTSKEEPQPESAAPEKSGAGSSSQSEESVSGNTDAQIRSAVTRLKTRLQEGSVRIPVLNPRVTGLVNMLNEQNADMEQVVEIIEGDAALASAVLRAANSSYYNRGKKIESVQDACVRLGTKNLVAICFEVVVSNLFVLKKEPYRKMAQHMWRNAVITSQLAGKLADLLNRPPGTEYIKIKALLHNVGELLCVQLLSELASEEAVNFTEDQIAKECVRLHETFGFALVKSWELPQDTIQLTGHHHQPARTSEPEHERLARHITLAAWKMALQAGFTYLPNHEDTNLEEHIAELELDPDQVHELIEKARSWEA